MSNRKNKNKNEFKKKNISKRKCREKMTETRPKLPFPSKHSTTCYDNEAIFWLILLCDHRLTQSLKIQQFHIHETRFTRCINPFIWSLFLAIIQPHIVGRHKTLLLVPFAQFELTFGIFFSLILRLVFKSPRINYFRFSFRFVDEITHHERRKKKKLWAKQMQFWITWHWSKWTLQNAIDFIVPSSTQQLRFDL